MKHLAPRVMLTCPRCDAPMTFTFYERVGNHVTWALSVKSAEHLESAHPIDLSKMELSDAK